MFSKFWSATTARAQVEKTHQQLRDGSDSLTSSSLQQVQQPLQSYGGDKDVFLSHSGEQKNFVRQLYRDLTIGKHVSCFFDEDDESLPPTQNFPSRMFAAAETCKIAFLLLSKEFIRSKWPMRELSAFIRAKNSGKNANLRLLPIFFMIEPRELNIDSPEWSEWQTLGVSNDERVEWQAALKEVRPIHGLKFVQNGNEVDFRDRVVEKICCILDEINRESHPQLLGFKPVGIEEAQKEVIDLLDLRDLSRRVVVIYGVGGIGKTTLANAVFSSLDLKGYHYCRVDMDQDSKQNDLKNIQEQILRDLFKKTLNLNSCTHGREKLREAFGKASKPVFLLIDNALRKKDLAELLPTENLSNLPMMSRILATTRNLNETNMLRLPQVIEVYPYRVAPLSKPEAKRLLCHHALGDKNGSFDRGVNMDGLLKICEGIPLVLRIVGSKLAADGNTVSACNEILEYHKTWKRKGLEGGEEDLSETMVDFVYGRLKEPSKQAFLDIVFFYYDDERSFIADVVGEMELRDLEGAALVTTYEQGRTKTVNMHDIVRARGRKLSEGNRITDWESLSILLRDKQKLQQTKGIWLPWEKLSIEAQHVDLMNRSLRVLSLGDQTKVNGRCERAFEELRFLHISFEDMLPIDLRKSRQLAHFEGGLMKLHGISEAKLTINLPDSLRYLSLFDDSQSDPPVSLDIYGNSTSLIEMHISSFTLERLPESVGNLEVLKMRGCKKMCTLPDNFGQLKSLKYLDLLYCEELERLPDDIVRLTSLAAVRVYGCAELEGKAMDRLVEIKSMLFLLIHESPMLIKRWEEIIQQERPLIGAVVSPDWKCYPYEEIMCTMLFNGGSRFLQVDGEGQLGECSYPEVGVKVGLLLTACDLSKEMNVKLREKVVELAYRGYQIIYVDVDVEGEVEASSRMEEREKRIRETLVQLPKGSLAWTSRFRKTTFLLAYSLWRFTGSVVDEHDPVNHAADTSIVGTSAVVDEQGRRKLSEVLFRSDVSDSPRVDFTTLLSPLHDAWKYLVRY